MKCFLATVFLGLCATTANAASIIYDVNRTIGEGTVTGTITTNGKLGVLGTTDILDWLLTLTIPDPGDPTVVFSDTFDSSELNSNVSISGSAVTAEATQLSYDFAKDKYMLFSGRNPGSSEFFWCLETAACNGADDQSEHIGVNTLAFYSVDYSGVSEPVVFATATVVPVPAAVWLFGSGLIGLVGFARRKR